MLVPWSQNFSLQNWVKESLIVHKPPSLWYFGGGCSVAQSCPTLCDSTDGSTPGFPVLHHLPVCSNSYPLSQGCHPTILSSVAPFFSCPPSLPISGFFPMSWLFPSGGQSIGASASASVLSVNIQGWFHLGLTGLIPLVFCCSNPRRLRQQFWRYQTSGSNDFLREGNKMSPGLAAAPCPEKGPGLQGRKGKQVGSEIFLCNTRS